MPARPGLTGSYRVGPKASKRWPSEGPERPEHKAKARATRSVGVAGRRPGLALALGEDASPRPKRGHISERPDPSRLLPVGRAGPMGVKG